MPLGDIAVGFFEIVGRFIGQLFIEIILEVLIKGPGYIIVRMFTSPSKKDIDTDGVLVLFSGVIFWVIIGFSAYWIYSSAKGS